MGSHHPIRKTIVPESPVIPDKLYFRIGDVARLCEVPAYVLRFWETEFPSLKPNKGGTGQRLYRKRDVEMALRIKSLLYDQGYTIQGARQVFKSEARPAPIQAPREIPGNREAPGLLETPVPAVPNSGIDVGAAMRHQAQRNAGLAALREQMQALRDLLLGPVSPSLATAGAGGVMPLRPRLVLEPRHTSRNVRHEPRLHVEQRDLFAADSSEVTEFADFAE